MKDEDWKEINIWIYSMETLVMKKRLLKLVSLQYQESESPEGVGFDFIDKGV